MIAADYRLSEARLLAGLPALDLEFHREYVGTGDPIERNERAAARSLKGARRSYSRVRRRATALDEVLDCDLRCWQVRDRLASVERTREEFG
jgi:hypothetical protein